MLVKQAANVLDILEYFAERKSVASVADIARHFGWPRSSTFNLVTTLAERGFLYERRDRGGFYPTPRWAVLAEAIATAEPLPEALPAAMDELAAATGETVVAAAAGGLHAVFVAVIESQQAIRYAAHVGKRLPIHATASGLALLSRMGARQRDAMLRRATFERHGSGTWMSVEAVEREIHDAQARGWFQSASSYSVDLGGVSLPLTVGDRTLAVTVAGPLFRMEGRWAEAAGQLRSTLDRHFGPGCIGADRPAAAKG